MFYANTKGLIFLKKIIAAALSILVGAFGYTIVDRTTEDRISAIESEIVDLKSDFYDHKQTGHIVQKNTEEFRPNQKLKKSPTSKSKFLLRVYDNGKIEFIKPSDLEYTQKSASTSLFPNNNYSDNTSVFNSSETSIIDDNIKETFQPATTISPTLPSTDTYEDYFLYLTDVSAQIKEITPKGSPVYHYNDDYSLISEYPKSTITIIINYKGYTNPVFASKKIHFETSISEEDTPMYVSSSIGTAENTVNSDGTFEYSETILVSPSFSTTNQILDYISTFSVHSVSID